MKKLLLGFSLAMCVHLSLRAGDYEQLPGHFGGFGSDESFAVADEFVLPRNTKVSLITWWGEDVPNPSKHFKIRLFSDNEGQPGVLLAEFSRPHIIKRKTGDFLIRGGHREPNLYPEYQFTLILPRPFYAKARVKYWLSVLSESVDEWTWEVSGSQENLGVQRSVFTDSVSGPWTPADNNTAFVLGRVPYLRPPKLVGN
jgi:hypothetical protein